MPLTQIDWPILQHFFCSVENTTGMPPQPLDATSQQLEEAQKKREAESNTKPKQLPKGVVLGPDGKPCRSCTSFGAWAAMTKQQQQPSLQQQTSTSAFPAQTAAATEPPPDCPPDVEQLGHSTWTLLHAMTANYPENPSPMQQAETKQFLGLFSKMYPCWVCADDFRAWMREGNEPKVSSRDDFGRWMCRAHNAVSEKLGKETFDCDKWEERWRIGWRDGRCD